MNQITITLQNNNEYLAKIELCKILKTITNENVTADNVENIIVTDCNIKKDKPKDKILKIKKSKPKKYLDANVIYETKNMSKNDWIKARKEGIGGSDAASVVGANPYKSAISVYLDKIDNDIKENDLNNNYKTNNILTSSLYKNHDESKNYKMELGNKLENFVAREFTLKTGKKVRSVNGVLRNDKYPFAIANIDKAVIGEKAFLECVVTNSFVKKEWIKEVPLQYKIQCYHYMAVSGATHAYVAALIGNEELIIHKIDREENIINDIMKLEECFWNDCIIGDKIPMPDGSCEYSSYLNNKYKYSKEDTLILFEKESILSRYDELHKDIKKYEKEKKAIEQYLKDQIQEYEIAYIGDRKITWKNQSKTTIDTTLLKKEKPEIAAKYMKVTNTRVFRI